MTYDRSAGWTASLRGVVAAMVTPMRPDGAIDLERVPDLVELLVSAGVAGVMVGGTTGEFIALTEDERRAVLEAVIDAVGGRVRVFAHVAHVDFRCALRLTEHAAGAGADALTAITPYYHRVSHNAIERSVRELLEVAPELPFFAYDYPDAAGAPFPPELFERLLAEPAVAGVKCSVGTAEELRRWLAFGGDVCVMSGNDSLLQGFVDDGGRAIVSGNAAAVPEVVVAAFDAAETGDRAAPTLAQLKELVAAGRGGAPDRLKHVLARRGLDVGPARIRTHTSDDLTADDDALLERLVAALGAAAPAGTR